MITRIVRMVFQEDKTESFEAIFESSKEKIRARQGCQYLSLHRDHHYPSTYYTVSKWDSQADLDAYRDSELFESTWAKTKALFADKPKAYSLEQLVELP
ncbi:putative quinol monooxygenase [Marinoscillum sp.]|uniref:putative quinol monooxygenase n=1 Tax=Marinoscillum sp. TaxID=2024838 RepID=UPI003BA945FE